MRTTSPHVRRCSASTPTSSTRSPSRGIDGALRHPAPHHRRRPRRPRRVRQGQDRLRQDARLRRCPCSQTVNRAEPEAARGARARAHPRARHSGHDELAPLGEAIGVASCRRLRRRRHRASQIKAPRRRRRRRRRHAGPPDRPDRAQGAVELARPRHRRGRRGRPHGRHGLPAPGRVAPAPRRRAAPDAAVLGHARRRRADV